VGALRERAPSWYFPAFTDALGGADPEEFAVQLRDLGGVRCLRDADVSEEQLEQCVAEASKRPELQMTAPPADADELRRLYTAAYC
jgi:hypothetical protein